MSRIATRGIQVDVDGEFWNVTAPPEDGEVEVVPFLSDSSEWLEFCLYLPFYSECRIEALGLDEGAEASPPSPYAPGLPLVFYGSSIMHGACASRPGLILPARVAEAMGRDFYNFGMTRILMISPPANGRAVGILKGGVNLSANLGVIREAVWREYERRKAAGEKTTYFINGLSLMGSDELQGLTDDLHPNDEGFALMAKRLIPAVEKILADKSY